MIASTTTASVVLKKVFKPLILYSTASFAGKPRAPIDLVKVRTEKKPELAPLMKKELKEKFPEFDQPVTDDNSMLPGQFDEIKLAPGEYLKHMDTSFESFFYQRDYTLKNFNFYL